MISEVPIGYLMKGAEMLPFMLSPPCRRPAFQPSAFLREHLDRSAGQHPVVARR